MGNDNNCKKLCWGLDTKWQLEFHVVVIKCQTDIAVIFCLDVDLYDPLMMVHSITLYKHAIPIPYRTREALERTKSEPWPGRVPQWTTSKCGTPYRVCQSKLYWSYPFARCNMSHPGVGCKVYQMGTLEVGFGTLSTKALECSQSKRQWHFTQYCGMAHYRTVCFKMRLNAANVFNGLTYHEIGALQTPTDISG